MRTCAKNQGSSSSFELRHFFGIRHWSFVISSATRLIRTEDLVITKKTTYVYRQGKDTVTIVFKDDKVQSKDSTLSD